MPALRGQPFRARHLRPQLPRGDAPLRSALERQLSTAALPLNRLQRAHQPRHQEEAGWLQGARCQLQRAAVSLRLNTEMGFGPTGLFEQFRCNSG